MTLYSNHYHCYNHVHVGARPGCPSRGTPNHLMSSNNQVARIDPHLIPSSDDAVRQYSAAGGRLTDFSVFGEDPLSNNTCLIQQREAEFHYRYPQFDPFFHKLVNGDDNEFCDGLLYFIQITQSLLQHDMFSTVT